MLLKTIKKKKQHKAKGGWFLLYTFQPSLYKSKNRVPDRFSLLNIKLFKGRESDFIYS